MNKHAKVPGLRNFIKPKSVLHLLNESYLRIYDMHLYIQANKCAIHSKYTSKKSSRGGKIFVRNGKFFV